MTATRWWPGIALVSINEVNVRRAWFILGWVTVSGHLSRYVSSHLGQLSLPSFQVGK